MVGSAADIQAWAQAVVTVTVGVLAVLTYRRARETVLQPFQTEVFKLQLEHAANVLNHFGGCSELDLRKQAGVTESMDLNADLVLLHHFNDLGWRLPPERIDDVRKLAVGGLYKFSSIWAAPGADADLSSKPDPPSTHLRLPHPSHGVAFTATAQSSLATLAELQANPFLPSSVTSAIATYSEAVVHSLEEIGEVTNLMTPRLTDQHDPNTLSTSEFHAAFNNEFNARCPALEPLAKAAVTAVRESFGLDKHFDFRRSRQ